MRKDLYEFLEKFQTILNDHDHSDILNEMREWAKLTYGNVLLKGEKKALANTFYYTNQLGFLEGVKFFVSPEFHECCVDSDIVDENSNRLMREFVKERQEFLNNVKDLFNHIDKNPGGRKVTYYNIDEGLWEQYKHEFQHRCDQLQEIIDELSKNIQY